MKVNEIFLSIDGEVNGFDGQGQPSAFIRFQGCSAGCSYCDTEYAQDFEKGEESSPGEIFDWVKSLGVGKITITGGEPFEQREALRDFLILNPYDTTIETNGLHRLLPRRGVFPLSPKIRYVMDIKLSSSGVEFNEELLQMNLRDLLPRYDWIKFVISSKEDYVEAMSIIYKFPISEFRIAFSPARYGEHWVVHPKEIVQWMHEASKNSLPGERRFFHINCQLHRLVEMR
jgi:7-carboxy-7-deazaguanine synthase